MHTLMVISAGFILLTVFVFGSRLLGVTGRRAAQAFALVWLLCAAVNMYVGVVSAGYPVAQEFPIFLVVFVIPAAAAFFLTRRSS